MFRRLLFSFSADWLGIACGAAYGECRGVCIAEVSSRVTAVW